MSACVSAFRCVCQCIRSCVPLLVVIVAGVGSAIAAEAPPVPVRHVDLVAEWRLPAEDEDYLIASLTAVAFDPQGRICIADHRQKNLPIFSREGQWLRTLGREGEGPGELRDVRNVFFDGDRYGLLQGVPAAVVWLKSDGTPDRRVTIAEGAEGGGTFVAVAHAVQAGSQILVWIDRSVWDGQQLKPGETGIAAMAPDGSVGPLIYRAPASEGAGVDGGIDEGKAYDIWWRRWTGDGRGGAWVAPERDEYLLQHWDAAGKLSREVRLPHEPAARSPRGRERIVEWLTRRGWKASEIRVGRTAPVVAELRLATDGRVWVRLDLGGDVVDGDVTRVYDIFDGNGSRVEQVRVHGGGDEISRTLLDDTSALSLTEDPNAEGQWLALERLVPRQ